MRGDLEVMIFYPDGNPPESFHVGTSSLSEKWSGFCKKMLDELGPVFKHNLGGTLSHLTIEMAGPAGRLFIHDRVCFEFWISRGRGSEQDQANVRHFHESISKHARPLASQF